MGQPPYLHTPYENVIIDLDVGIKFVTWVGLKPSKLCCGMEYFLNDVGHALALAPPHMNSDPLLRNV